MLSMSKIKKRVHALSQRRVHKHHSLHMKSRVHKHHAARRMKSRVQKNHVRTMKSRVQKHHARRMKSRVQKHHARRMKSRRLTRSHHKYHGVSADTFKDYLTLDEKVHRLTGDSETENRVRKDINELGRDVMDKSEPEILANEFLYLERLYKGMIDSNNNVVDKNSNGEKKHIDEKGYYNILDDLYNEETPEDYDAFAIKTSPDFDSVKKVLDQYDPSNAGKNSSELQKKIVRESDNNRGFFSTDKPRGPKVRTSEKAKRKVSEVASSVVTKVSTTVGNLADLAGKAVDFANEGINAVGKTTELATSTLKAAESLESATANAIEKVGDAASEVINTGAKALELGSEGLRTVQKVGDVAISGVQAVGSAVEIAGSAVSVVKSGLEVTAAASKKAASTVKDAADAIVQSL